MIWMPICRDLGAMQCRRGGQKIIGQLIYCTSERKSFGSLCYNYHLNKHSTIKY